MKIEHEVYYLTQLHWQWRMIRLSNTRGKTKIAGLIYKCDFW